MKKNIILVSAIATVFSTLSFTACAKSPVKTKVEMKTAMDTLAYALGVANTDGLKRYLVEEMKMDTAMMNDFVKGFMDAQKDMKPKESAYMAGVELGNRFKKQVLPELNKQIYPGDSNKTINKEAFFVGFANAASGKFPIMDVQDARNIIEPRMAKIREQDKAVSEAKAITDADAFMAQVKGLNGAVATPSGLYYQVINAGTGAKPKSNSIVKIHYHGTLADGKVFDSSVERNEPAELEVSRVIPGFSEGLQLMSVGAKYRFFIPYQLAYGERGAGAMIKPYSPLIFEIELLEIVK